MGFPDFRKLKRKLTFLKCFPISRKIKIPIQIIRLFLDLDYLEDDFGNESVTEEEDLGRPEAVEFEWTRGGHVVSHVRSKEWVIDPVSFECVF